jgi:hypothetical protein
MEALAQFFTSSPVSLGAMLSAVGIFLFLLSYFDSDFLFGSVSAATYSPRKIDGLKKSNKFTTFAFLIFN